MIAPLTPPHGRVRGASFSLLPMLTKKRFLYALLSLVLLVGAGASYYMSTPRRWSVAAVRVASPAVCARTAATAGIAPCRGIAAASAVAKLSPQLRRL